MATIFFVAQDFDFAGQAEDLSRHRAVVANGSAAHRWPLRYAGTQVLAYFDALTSPDAGSHDPWYQSLRAALEPHCTQVRAADGRGRYLRFSDLSGAQALASWARDPRCVHYYDGFYVDNFFEVLPDEDRKAVGPDQAAAFPAWRDALASALTPGRPCLANSAGFVDRRFRGVGVEASHRARLGNVATLSRFVVQYNGCPRPCLNVDWSGAWELGDVILRGVVRGG